MILLAVFAVPATGALVCLQVRACMQDRAAIAAGFAREHAVRAAERVPAFRAEAGR